MKTPIAECPSSGVNLHSYRIEANEESYSDDPDDCIEIPEDSCVFTLTPVDFENIDGLLLIHPQLIDWDQHEPPQLDTFQNDEAFNDYLGIRDDIPIEDHKEGFIIELDSVTYLGENAKPFSHKNIKIKTNHGSYGENHIVAVSDPKKVKRKDISEGENLSEVPQDGRFDTLPMTSCEEK